MFETVAWLLLFLPLMSVAAITLFTRGNPARSGAISITAVLGSFGCALLLFYGLPETSIGEHWRIPWLWIGEGFKVDIGLRLDHLSLPMLVVVTGVASLIHIYSWGYMKGDPGFSRYFAFLSLFMFSMLGIVLADNFLMMFIFWELVGVSSYLLIGFWFERESAADACKKAFLTNRVGDFGFLVGILMAWAMFGSLSFDQLKPGVDDFLASHGGSTRMFLAAGLLIFCGAAGKSAQFPFHVWLPDAMEGPTPVSALIHAATMVAAGVYMLCRVFFIIEPSGALPVIAWVGGFTSLLAAVIAVQQNDIKRILAYSTLSQLGYMVMAVGLGGPKQAMFHLTTHAFFKALLFLGAGSVILGMHHEQNIWKMGGLKKKMPVTYWTFMAGTLALCAVPPLSGFYSKDGILALALGRGTLTGYALFVVGAVVAMLTTLYMFRLVLVVFEGGERSDGAGHAHESPSVMVWPLRILAVFSIFGGVIGIEKLYAAHFEPEVAAQPAEFWRGLVEPFVHSFPAAALGILALLAGYYCARSLYRSTLLDPLPEQLGWLSRAMRNKFYFDEFYENLLIPCTQDALARLAAAFDQGIMFGVRGVHGTTELSGRLLRLLQTGSLQTYAFLLVAGVALVLYIVLAH
jgi:NADH-quinone oxidoreductase subunit L